MTDPARLNAVRVRELFALCQGKSGESTTTTVAGIVHLAAFDTAEIATHTAEIAGLLDELPVEFQTTGGGGMSFLNACMDRHGNQWTGEHMTMEALFQLGIAAGRARCLLPRELWDALPGGMPYYVVGEMEPAS